MVIRIVGLHPVEPTSDEFDRVLSILWGDELVGAELQRAQDDVRQHFAGLYLVEIEVRPPESPIEWMDITQPIDGKSSNNWQVPWDERATGIGRWAFFMHFLQLDRPLQTQCGPIDLPQPTPMPQHLLNEKYYLPG
jgi:hypothetical protein